jgi:glutamine synthetase
VRTGGTRRHNVALLCVAPFVLLPCVILVGKGNVPLSVNVWIDEVGVYAYLVSYCAICVAAPIFARRTSQAVVWTSIFGLVGIGATVYTFYNQLVPKPPFPLDILPYVFLACIAVGVTYYAYLRARRKDLVRKSAPTPTSSQMRDADALTGVADAQKGHIPQAMIRPDGAPDPMTAEHFLAEHRVRAVDVMLVDAWGMPRGKRVPLTAFLEESSIHIGAATFSGNADAFLDETPFISAESGYPDMVARPDLTSLTMSGYADDIAVVMCDCVDATTGEAIVMDARALVKRSLEQYASLGYAVNLGVELEYHLFDADWRPAWDEIGLYSLDVHQRFDSVLRRTTDALAAAGINVENSSIEYSPGQVEITQRYDEALSMLDKTVLFKQIVRQVSEQCGYHATFMAKPATELGGSGMHMHLSLFDEEGTNPFGTSDANPPLYSTTLRRFTPGLLAHQCELQAITHPTLNAYKRAVDYSFAPTQVTWGIDNRHAGLRCLPGKGKASRVEIRWASAGTNLYAVAHGYLQAGLHGLGTELPLIDECIGDAYSNSRWERIANRPEEALETFERSEFIAKAYGAIYAKTICALQRNELKACAAHVTDWEISRYRTRL